MIGIYKITNLINGKCYIGQSVNIEKRWGEHITIYNHPRCSNYHIYKAFRKYGIENFSFSVIEECKQALLNEREKFWIAQYDSFKHGYNMTIGGDGSELIERSVVYRLWDEGFTMEEIAEKVQCSQVTISRIIRGYEKYNKNDSLKRGKLWRRKRVVQYGLDGSYLFCYSSISDASKATGITADGISACCNKRLKSSGGYQWSFDSQENIRCYQDTLRTHRGKRKRVRQYTKTNELIAEYKNISEAQHLTGVGRLTISRVCNGIQQYGDGYIWRFVQ